MFILIKKKMEGVVYKFYITLRRSPLRKNFNRKEEEEKKSEKANVLCKIDFFKKKSFFLSKK